MSYGMAAALQKAVYLRLVADEVLDGLIGGAIHDALPPGLPPPLYVALGPEKVRERSDASGRGAEHDFTVIVVTESAGFARAKEAAAAVSDALLGADLILERGRVVLLDFLQARALRAGVGDERRIEMSFRALIEDN